MSRTVRIEGLGGRGRGVTHFEDGVCFVSGALPGELVEIGQPMVRHGTLEAVGSRVAADPHPAREHEPCPHAGRCGGCDWPHVLPGPGAELKREVAAAAARTHPALAERLLAAPVTPSPLRYRLRARLHWDPAHGVLGFYRRGSWSVTGIRGCRLLSPRLGESLGQLESVLGAVIPAPVDVEWLEDLEGREAIAAVRPARGGPRELSPEWLPPLEPSGPVDGWWLLARSGRVVAGHGASHVTMALPVPLAVPPGAFFQVNRHLVPVIFQRVAALAGTGSEPVWDLHGGVGLLGAAATAAGQHPLTLVEPFRPAGRAAAANLPHARVVAGRTAEAYLARHRRLSPDAIVLTDPPRSGMTPKLRHQLAGWHPSRIVSMACDAATWARDTAFLLGHGYELTHVELLDLFPSTAHVEVLSVLTAS